MGVFAAIGEWFTNRDEAKPERDGEERSFSLSQLGLMFRQANGGLGVSSLDEALRDAATWQCVKVKAQGIAQLPADVVRYEGSRRVPVPAPKIVERPSDLVPRRVWMFQAGASMFTDGNVFGRITAVDSMQRPTSIELFDPSTVHDRRVVDGVKQVKVQGEVLREFPNGDLWHVAGEMVQAGSPFGLSPVWYGSKHTATALAAEAFGGQFFTEGGHPSALLKVTGDPGQKGAEDIKEKFRQITRGSREPIVMPSDITYEKLQVDPKDSQFIELMEFEVLQACRRHGVPPSMVFASMSGQNITYQNVTQSDLQFLKHSLSYPIDLFEDAISALLPRPRVLKLNRDAILRADPAARWAIHDLRLKNRSTSIDEVRSLEDELPYGGEFAVPGVPPLASTTGETAEEQKARNLTEMIQKVYLGVGVVLTADEAREILNAAGGDLPAGFTPTQGGGGQ